MTHHPHRASCFPTRILPSCFTCNRYRPGTGEGMVHNVIIDASSLAKGDRCPMLVADKASHA